MKVVQRGRTGCLLKGVFHRSERKEVGKDEPGHEDASDHEAARGHKARPLQAAQTHDGVTTCAATGVARAEADHEATDHEEDEEHDTHNDTEHNLHIISDMDRKYSGGK